MSKTIALFIRDRAPDDWDTSNLFKELQKANRNGYDQLLLALTHNISNAIFEGIQPTKYVLACDDEKRLADALDVPKSARELVATGETEAWKLFARNEYLMDHSDVLVVVTKSDVEITTADIIARFRANMKPILIMGFDGNSKWFVPNSSDYSKLNKYHMQTHYAPLAIVGEAKKDSAAYADADGTGGSTDSTRQIVDEIMTEIANRKLNADVMQAIVNFPYYQLCAEVAHTGKHHYIDPATARQNLIKFQQEDFPKLAELHGIILSVSNGNITIGFDSRWNEEEQAMLRAVLNDDRDVI